MEQHPARMPLIVLFVLLFAFAAVTVYKCGSIFLVDGPNTTGESGKVYYARKAQRGQSIFPPPLERPYYPAIHGAFLHASVGLLGRLFSANEHGLYLIGRAISLASAVFALATSVLLLRRCNVPAWGQVFAVVAIMAPMSMMQHAVSYRPDNWILGLSVLAATLLTRQRVSPITGAVLMVIPVLAFFVKATGLSLLGSIALALWIRSQRRFALVYVPMTLLLLVLVIAAINYSSSGAFVANLTKGAKMPLSARYPLVILKDNPELITALLFPIAVLIAPIGRSDSGGSTRAVLLAFWAVALASGLLATLRSGSQHYYFLESWFFGILIFVTYAGDAIRGNERRVLLSSATIIFLMLGMLSVRRNLSRTVGDFSWALTKRFGDERHLIAAYVNEKKLRCYSDDDGLNVLLDDPAVIYPFVQAQLIRTGSIAPETLTEPLLKQQYDLILLTEVPFSYQGTTIPSKELRDLLEKHYERDGKLGGYARYVPRSGK